MQKLLSDYLGEAVDTDLADEAVAIKAGTAAVYVRLIDADPPVVRVFSPLLRGVPQRADLLEELNCINGHLNFVRLFWREDMVVASTELLATTLGEPELAHACEALADAADYYDERLHQRYGGELSFGCD